MEKQAAEISIENATLRYRDELIFKNLSLTFQRGEWNGLLGRSGVGKTSLLRLLAGLAGNHERETQMAGRVLPMIQGEVAYMAQQDALLPWLNVLENVLITFKLQSKRNNHKEKAKQLLAKVGLSAYERHYPQALSGGMRQRVALVRTLLQEKSVILMDEPFSALDAITRFEIQNLSFELLAGKTVILVTHDPLEALRLCSNTQILGARPAVLLEKITLGALRLPRDVGVSAFFEHYHHILQLLQQDIVPANTD